MGGFLDKLWHRAASRVSQDVSHPSSGLHDLADLAYNASGAHDVVDAAEDPTNWKADAKAAAVLGGYVLPGVLAGRAIGGLGADVMARYGAGAIPGMAEVATNPADPQGYINTVLGAVPGAFPSGGLDHAIENTMGLEKQKALAAALGAAVHGGSPNYV